MFFIISYEDKYLLYQTQCMIPTTETVLTFLSTLCLPRPAVSLHTTIMMRRTCWCQRHECHRAALAIVVTAITMWAICNLYMWANWSQRSFWWTWFFQGHSDDHWIPSFKLGNADLSISILFFPRYFITFKHSVFQPFALIALCHTIWLCVRCNYTSKRIP